MQQYVYKLLPKKIEIVMYGNKLIFCFRTFPLSYSKNSFLLLSHKKKNAELVAIYLHIFLFSLHDTVVDTRP